MNPGRLSLEKRAERVVERAFGIKDLRMRTAVLGEFLQNLSAEDIVSALSIILERADRRRPKYQEVYLSLMCSDTLTEMVGVEKAEQIRQRARESGCPEVINLFPSSLPESEQQITGDLEIPAGLEYLTLGEKKSLARGKRTLVWQKLFFDLDAPVIRNLLQNPRITEIEVIRIASRRPCPGSVLKTIYENSRWIKRYRVKRVLVFNPSTPVGISKRLIRYLMSYDLEAVSRDLNLDPTVREVAENLIKKRGEKKRT